MAQFAERSIKVDLSLPRSHRDAAMSSGQAISLAYERQRQILFLLSWNSVYLQFAGDEAVGNHDEHDRQARAGRAPAWTIRPPDCTALALVLLANEEAHLVRVLA
ncbi:hypothetical protein SSBR45G_10120 [Bradyrhizobium sp. SSBR45G]|nr:hypothetical protein SSBR45G_10120 [Bradyrhizobium sp. SSBR45G]GLH83412.1 hypothetical protein SSBR45R_08720 [Bradyrhizobium sp. SSBR45R]